MKTGITRVIFFAVIVCFSIGFWGMEEAEAVVAAPVVHTLMQADGSEFAARPWGDEWLHGWETEDGYSIVFDEASQILMTRQRHSTPQTLIPFFSAQETRA